MLKFLAKKIGLIPLILLSFVVIAVIPPVIMMVFEPADIVMRLILVFLIFSSVRGYIGTNLMSILISGILIYFLVIKWAYVTASLYLIIYVFLGMQVFSVLVWGIGTNAR